VIAEQHISLTETFSSPWHFPDSPVQTNPNDPSPVVGEVFLKCNAASTIQKCFSTLLSLSTSSNNIKLPTISLTGHLTATFPYILSHLEYIIGELLRNSIQAIIERQMHSPLPPGWENGPPPIEVTVCEAAQHVIIRVSDQGGGIPRDILPHLWSFSKGPRSTQRLQNLASVPKMAATMQELVSSPDTISHPPPPPPVPSNQEIGANPDSSLSSLSSRPPNLRLGMGLPLSRVYAEYWAGKLEVHSLEGYGVDAFLQISKLGNKNEQLSTRAMVDAV
jgi:pyruvate dehydrogenase kinase 2/3/4